MALPLLLIAGVVYAAPLSLTDILFKLGLLQKQVDILAEQINSEPKLGGVSAFSNCFINAPGTLTAPLVISTAGATTTSSVCDTQGKAKKLALLGQVGSVTTAGSLFTFDIQFSHNNTDFFTESSSALPSNGVASYAHTASSTHRFVSSNIGTTTFAVPIDNVLARYIRIRFSANEAQMNFAGILVRQEDQN